MVVESGNKDEDEKQSRHSPVNPRFPVLGPCFLQGPWLPCIAHTAHTANATLGMQAL